MKTPESGAEGTRNAILVLPFHLMAVDITYWQVCVEDQRHCVGFFDDLDAALARARELATLRAEVGQSTRILARRTRLDTWSVVDHVKAIGQVEGDPSRTKDASRSAPS